MSQQNVGRLDAGSLQQLMQLDGAVGGGARRARRAAPAQSAAIIRCRRRKARDRLLNVKPVQIGGGNPRFKDHGGSARSFFHEVEPALVTRSEEHTSELQS